MNMEEQKINENMLEKPSQTRKTLEMVCIALLGMILFAKLLFPEAVAELTMTFGVMDFDELIVENIFIRTLVQFIMGYFVYFFYICAACRIRYMNRIESIIVIGVILLQVVLNYGGINTLYNLVVDVSLLTLPLLFTIVRKTISVKHFYSTIIAYLAHNCSQVVSMSVRNIGDLIYPTFCSTFIIMIDAHIVQVLLYLYYTEKPITKIVCEEKES